MAINIVYYLSSHGRFFNQTDRQILDAILNPQRYSMHERPVGEYQEHFLIPTKYFFLNQGPPGLISILSSLTLLGPL